MQAIWHKAPRSKHFLKCILSQFFASLSAYQGLGFYVRRKEDYVKS